MRVKVAENYCRDPWWFDCAGSSSPNKCGWSHHQPELWNQNLVLCRLSLDLEASNKCKRNNPPKNFSQKLKELKEVQQELELYMFAYDHDAISSKTDKILSYLMHTHFIVHLHESKNLDMSGIMKVGMGFWKYWSHNIEFFQNDGFVVSLMQQLCA